MKFGIVIFPSKSIQDAANAFRKRYDPHYSLIPPHITVKSPFTAAEEDAKTIAKELKNIVSSIEPFQLTVGNVSSFSPVNKVIYFKVEKNEAIMALNEALYTGYFAGEREYAFVPHVTIAQDLSDGEHSDVLGQLRMMEFHHEQLVDRIHLLYQLEDGSWTVYETFQLGRDC